MIVIREQSLVPRSVYETLLIKNFNGENMKQIITKHHQQGIALVMALIMLLLITVLGVSAARMSGLDTQVAGNSMYSMMVFQGAESALGRAISADSTTRKWYYLKEASDRSGKEQVDTTNFPDELVTGGAKLDSEITVEYETILNGPVFNNVANSSDFKYQVFRYSADTKLLSTAARDKHIEGRAVQMPKP